MTTIRDMVIGCLHESEGLLVAAAAAAASATHADIDDTPTVKQLNVDGGKLLFSTDPETPDTVSIMIVEQPQGRVGNLLDIAVGGAVVEVGADLRLGGSVRPVKLRIGPGLQCTLLKGVEPQRDLRSAPELRS